LRREVARLLDEMAAILSTGAYPKEITLKASGDVGIGPHTASGIINEATAGGQMAEAVLADLRETLAHFAEPPPEIAIPPAAAPAGGFFSADAFSNVVHVRYALKTTAAAMICYATYMLLDWPGIHTCLITCYIVSLGTAAETMEKLTLRISGALIGAAAGLAAIVFVMPYVTSIGGLMAVVFLAVLASAWVAAGSPRIGYVGFQIAFAFLLCVVQGSSPAFDLSIARDRVVGILFGNLVTALLSVSLWPVSVGQRVDPAITTVLRRLGAMANASSRSQRISLATDAHASLTTLEQTLDLARYEPATVAPARNWLEGRRRVASAIAALGGSLLLSRDRREGASRDLAGRLDGLAALLDHPPQASTVPATDATLLRRGADTGSKLTVLPIGDKVAFHLRTLERVLAEEIAGCAEGKDPHARP
jgi:multidrug resistance protein MdtO